jgi:hypothetical protein
MKEREKMSIDPYEIARSTGQLSLLSPKLAELEAQHRQEERHAERMRELSEQRQNPALVAEIARLEQENAHLRARLASYTDGVGNGVTVTLPHMSKTLEAVLAIMRRNWSNPDPMRLPKQVNIAREIDAALEWKEDGDGNPSRNARTIAALIKPDSMDPKHGPYDPFPGPG